MIKKKKCQGVRNAPAVPRVRGSAASREGRGMLSRCVVSPELCLGLRHLKVPGSVQWAGSRTPTIAVE